VTIFVIILTKFVTKLTVIKAAWPHFVSGEDLEHINKKSRGGVEGEVGRRLDWDVSLCGQIARN
jgi:hypothetical protein